MKVLVAEDDRVTRFALTTAIQRWGYDVIEAKDGCEALSALRRRDGPQLAVLDWAMPEMTGTDVCRMIRSFSPQEQNYVYVIVLTGKETLDDMLEGFDAGADDYVIKPFKPEELRARLRAAQRILDLHDSLHTELAERKRAEDALRRTQEEFVTIFNSAPIPMFLFDEPLCTLYVNSAGRTLVHSEGDDAGRVLGHLLNCANLTETDSTCGTTPFCASCPLRSLLVQALHTGNPSGEQEIPFEWKQKGRETSAVFLVSSVRLQSPEGPRLLLSLLDLTERKEMEHKLHQSQKLQSIGQLTAGIAHEINTPMQFIGDNTKFLQESLGRLCQAVKACREFLLAVKEGTVFPEQWEQVKQQIAASDFERLLDEMPLATKQSLEGIARVTKIVQAMKEFSHPGVGGRTAVNLNHAIESTIVVARNEWKYIADMETDLDPSLPDVFCHVGEINQVILNLITNATDAIQDAVDRGLRKKGTITVSTRRDGDVVEVRVADTGAGMSEEVRKDIFLPFFTTKQLGKGTGQGLSVCYGIVAEKHGGSIHFETKENVGTTFIVRLPFAPKIPESLPDSPVEASLIFATS